MSGGTRIAGAVVAVAVLGASALPALAQTNKVVDTRHQVMRAFSGTMKAVGGWVKTGNGNPAAIEAQVLMMAAVAKEIPGLFPKGTSSEDLGVKVSGAKPEIWARWSDYGKAADALSTESRRLAAAIRGGDRPTVGKQLGMTGKIGCGGCHQPFRTKRPK